MDRFLGVFDLVPGWVYALALAAVMLAAGTAVGFYSIRTAGAERDTAKALRTLYDERGQHARELATQTALVLKATNELNTARAVQEKRDGDAQATIAALGEDMRRRSRAAGGHGLRDPSATAGGCAAGAGPGPVAGAGGEDDSLPGRPLSEFLEGLLLERFAQAETINAAYASCRTDALNLRASLRQLQHPSPATAP